jgi:hypothetical protein
MSFERSKSIDVHFSNHHPEFVEGSVQKVAIDHRATGEKVPALGDRGLPLNKRTLLAL